MLERQSNGSYALHFENRMIFGRIISSVKLRLQDGDHALWNMLGSAIINQQTTHSGKNHSA
jgi:hypothetical protein